VCVCVVRLASPEIIAMHSERSEESAGKRTDLSLVVDQTPARSKMDRGIHARARVDNKLGVI